MGIKSLDAWVKYRTRELRTAIRKDNKVQEKERTYQLCTLWTAISTTLETYKLESIVALVVGSKKTVEPPGRWS